MKITVNPIMDMETLQWVSNEGEYEYTGPLVLFDRAAQKQATQIANTAGSTASQFGTNAATERAPLQAYDIQNLQNPQGIGQQGVHELLTASLGGAGGTSSSLVGAETMAAKRGTTGVNSATLDDIARQRMKATAGASEDIAAKDVMLKQQQKSAAADDLSRRYGIDVSAQLGQGELQNKAIDTELKAGQSGWFQNLMQGITVAEGAGKAMFGGAGGAGMFAPGGAFGSSGG